MSYAYSIFSVGSLIYCIGPSPADMSYARVYTFHSNCLEGYTGYQV